MSVYCMFIATVLRDLRGLLTARGASLKVKGKIYRACVQRVLVYGSETWPMKKDDSRYNKLVLRSFPAL